MAKKIGYIDLSIPCGAIFENSYSTLFDLYGENWMIESVRIQWKDKNLFPDYNDSFVF